MDEVWSRDLDSGKHLNSIVDTWSMTYEEREYFTGISIIKRVGHPRDIANAILFPASDAASYITGENIQVDGGTRLLV